MTVYLVGAGPGDPDLMTVRARGLIERADVIIYDRLLSPHALDGARSDALRIFAGKRAHGERAPQCQTTRLLLEHGATGRLVVRLEGGDPFVFGRGGEEAQALAEAQIPFEVVPGLSAGFAVPAYAGIPVTHRELASAVAFVTGHELPDAPGSKLDWDALAAFPGTLVIYMGLGTLPETSARLLAAGRSATEAAVVIQHGTLRTQRAVHGTLDTVAALAAEAQLSSPSLVVVGPVAALGERLAWLRYRALHGISVVLTRPREQAGPMAERLGALGAEVINTPVIRTETLAGPLPSLSDYDLVCFTSANGVRSFFSRLADAGLDARSLAPAPWTRIAAIGPATARALEAYGVRADLVPARAVGEALADVLSAVPVKQALIARAKEARDVVPDALRAHGAEVDLLAVYQTLDNTLDSAQIQQVAEADFITFTSGSTVAAFLRAVGGASAWVARSRRPRNVSIGPVTSAALREQGLAVELEASPHNADAMIDAILTASASEQAVRPDVS